MTLNLNQLTQAHDAARAARSVLENLSCDHTTMSGVHLIKSGHHNYYRASLSVRGRQFYLGNFTLPAEAGIAVDYAKRKLAPWVRQSIRETFNFDTVYPTDPDTQARVEKILEVCRAEDPMAESVYERQKAASSQESVSDWLERIRRSQTGLKTVVDECFKVFSDGQGKVGTLLAEVHALKTYQTVLLQQNGELQTKLDEANARIAELESRLAAGISLTKVAPCPVD